MGKIQTDYQINPSSSELPEAEIIEDIDLSGGRRGLALRVKIEGRDHTFALSTDALQAAGMTGPAAVAAIRDFHQSFRTIGKQVLERLDNLAQKENAGRG